MAMFETTVTNAPYNQQHNVAGLFGTGTGTSFVAADCPAGTLCVKNGLVPSEGYESFGILNGNTHYFNLATSGVVVGYPGDHTGIYASNSYDVNKVTNGNGQTYNLGANTLGLPILKGERGTFTELIVGESYTWDIDGFTAAPTVGQFATISATGTWTPSATEPTTSGAVYARVERTKNVNEGVQYHGLGYVLKILRAVVSA